AKLAGPAPEPWAALIQQLARSEQPDQALAALAEAQRVLPADAAKLVAASGYEALRRPQQAEAQYQAARADRPDDAQVLRAAAGFYLRGKQTAKALPLLRHLLQVGGVAETDAAWARRGLALCLGAELGYAAYREALRLIDDNLRAPADHAE